MTNYGEILDRQDDEDRAKEARKARLAAERAERLLVDKEFETHVLLAEKPKTTCSANSDLVKYAKHLKTVRTVLKAAEADGFCLDEIMDGLKELGE